MERSHARPPARPYWAAMLLTLLCLVAMMGTGIPTTAQNEAETVYIVPISGTIDLGLAPYLNRILDQAAEQGVDAVVLDIDTPGGGLDAVLQMRDALLGSQVRTIAFVDRTALSAGALIAISADEIYMAPGGTMGAATPIDGATGETASEKVVSAVRSIFRTTAETRGRDPAVAEAMVDPDVAIDGLVGRGELLTLTTSEAVAWDYADGVADNRAELLAATGLENATIVDTAPSLAESVVRFITDPVAASLLITVAILLIIGDLFIEGFGIVGVLGLGLLATLLWGHYLAGLTGWEDVALVVIGLILIIVEILIIPGFGIAGVLGLAALLGGLFLAMLGRDIQTPEGIEQAALTVAASLVAIIFGVIALVRFLPRNRSLGRLVLDSVVGGDVPTAGQAASGWLRWFGDVSHPPQLAAPTPDQIPESVSRDGLLLSGATGIAVSDLRPSGIASFDGQTVDVVSGGEYITAGETIELVRDEGYRRVVRRSAR